ncbi:PREDICTED: glucose-dependent insulinotropic receptor-like, partial [Pterocles gutturalis]|uniref:glucose-dependent insulinotropic receptor-like n=1 Tax=Pterocles gutturalis TaxID=240206 RepID=UPI0005291F2A
PRQVFCVLRMAFVTSSSAASIISLILVAGDRHLAIRKPFHYFQLVTGWWVGVRLVGVWLVAAIIGFLPIRGVEQAGLAGGCPPSRPTSDMKAMRTVAVLIGCFTVSWLPFFIASIAQTVCPGCFHYGVIENYLWLL